MLLSKNVSLDKAIYSTTAIRKGLSNTPNATQIANMKNVCKVVIEPLIERFGVNNTHLNSFFRSEKVNRAVGGSSTSQHRFGEAVDIGGLNNISNDDIAKWAIQNIKFDQIIFEFKQGDNWAWIHISTKIDVTKNRRVILEAKKNSKNETYYEDITSEYF